jgi:hypothetical protein
VVVVSVADAGVVSTSETDPLMPADIVLLLIIRHTVIETSPKVDVADKVLVLAKVKLPAPLLSGSAGAEKSPESIVKLVLTAISPLAVRKKALNVEFPVSKIILPPELISNVVEILLLFAGVIPSIFTFPFEPLPSVMVLAVVLSVYHGDNNKVVMTHYYAFGNQPRMKLAKTGDSKTVKFDFLDGSNSGSHMHQLTLKWVGSNHLTHEWVFHQNGKPAHTAKFYLHRIAM